ncbi:MAG: T9SS type A sorting domain-containing protein [Flavobacteriales bacterium]|nr:T9SS type A sorting domain-containing protein [Flavobacteriales bacterium]
MKYILLLPILIPLFTVSQQTYVPDANFEHHLIDIGLDSGFINGYVLTANISGHLGLNLTGLSISDLTGIEDFVALESLYCGDNQLTNLDLSQNFALTQLSCYENILTNLDVSSNIALTTLNCEDNLLTSLDVSQHPTLTSLFCSGNQLSSLNANGASALNAIYCVENELTSIDVNGATGLTILSCGWNELTSLDLVGAPALGLLHCDNNHLTSLDISQNSDLTSLFCNYNQISCLNVKNGNNINFFYMETIFNNLLCIEVDDPVWSSINWTATNANIDQGVSFSTNCNYPSGCYSTPTTIQENTNSINLYPNPSSDYVMIEVESIPSQLVLMDLQGKIIREELISNKTHIMDVSALDKGIYFVRIGSFSSKVIVE